MDNYPHWAQLPIADRLRIAAVEAELVEVPPRCVEAICEAADLLESQGVPVRGQRRKAKRRGPKKPSGSRRNAP
jgi:hypothetical protein